MHEFSVVQSLLKTIERLASEQKASEVTGVILKVGLLSGIEPHLFKTAFDTFKEGTIAARAGLVLNEDGLTLRCSECNGITHTDRLVFKCHKCSSLHVEVLSGEDLILERLEMECP